MSKSSRSRKRRYVCGLRQLRKSRGLTQADVARLLRCSRETISRIETGVLLLSEGMEARLAYYLHLTNHERNLLLGHPGVIPPDGDATNAAHPPLRLLPGGRHPRAGTRAAQR